MKLPAPYALKKYVVEYSSGSEHWNYDGPLNTEEEIEAAYNQMVREIGFDYAQDVMYGRFENNLEVESGMWSRHCEVEMAVVQVTNGDWISFPRYYGGGKHFEEYAWYDTSIQFAQYVDCKEEEKLMVVRTFTKQK